VEITIYLLQWWFPCVGPYKVKRVLASHENVVRTCILGAYIALDMLNQLLVYPYIHSYTNRQVAVVYPRLPVWTTALGPCERATRWLNGAQGRSGPSRTKGIIPATRDIEAYHRLQGTDITRLFHRTRLV
jgi:hypothetical protein